MNSRRQPLLTLSPSHGDIVSPSLQITPKLPRRERLNSISRLLKNRSFSEFSEKRSPPPVRILITTADCLTTTLEEQSIHQKCSPKSVSPASSSPASPLYSPDQNKSFLGRGSFGKVTLCQYKGRKVAVKILHNELNVIGERNVLGLCHPHLVQVFHISELLDGTKLVFMEFAGHCNLQQVLDTKSELAFRRRLSFCIQIVKGLCHCHLHDIVHGDVKPANVMVSSRGVCKLGDFGHSFRLENPVKVRKVGTAAYAAPEVLRGSGQGQPSDVFSLGILLWQVHTREVPFAGEHPHVIIYKVVHYDTRPEFEDNLSPILTSYAQVATGCWRSHSSQRLTAQQVLVSLQDIMQRIRAS